MWVLLVCKISGSLRVVKWSWALTQKRGSISCDWAGTSQKLRPQGNALSHTHTTHIHTHYSLLLLTHAAHTLIHILVISSYHFKKKKQVSCVVTVDMQKRRHFIFRYAFSCHDSLSTMKAVIGGNRIFQKSIISSQYTRPSKHAESPTSSAPFRWRGRQGSVV